MSVDVIREIAKSVNVFRQTPLESLRLNIQAVLKQPIRKPPLLAKSQSPYAMMPARRRHRVDYLA